MPYVDKRLPGSAFKLFTPKLAFCTTSLMLRSFSIAGPPRPSWTLTNISRPHSLAAKISSSPLAANLETSYAAFCACLSLLPSPSNLMSYLKSRRPPSRVGLLFTTIYSSFPAPFSAYTNSCQFSAGLLIVSLLKLSSVHLTSRLVRAAKRDDCFQRVLYCSGRISSPKRKNPDRRPRRCHTA